MSLADYLGDAESCLIRAQRTENRKDARDARDYAQCYMAERAHGAAEPWEGADDLAGDIESEAIGILHENDLKPVTCGSLICKLLGFHIKGPHE
jgi:hypothetical protein